MTAARNLLSGLIATLAFASPAMAQKSCPFKLTALYEQASAAHKDLVDAVTANDKARSCGASARSVAAAAKIVAYMETYQVGCVIDENLIDRAKLRLRTANQTHETIVARGCTRR